MSRLIRIILCLTLLLSLSCRKDQIDIRKQFTGEYLMTYKSHSDAGGYGVQDTSYFYTGSVSLHTNPDFLEITGIGGIQFHKTNLHLGSPTSISAYDGSSSGYFMGDTAFTVGAGDSYWGHTWWWRVEGTRIN